MHEYKRIRTIDYSKHLADGREKITVIKLFRQMGNDFAVRFRLEYMAFFQKIFFQIHVVFNNAIVNDDKMIIFIPMGMGIHIWWFAVSCPSGMPDTDIST